MDEIKIIKKDPWGNEVWTYYGKILAQSNQYTLVEAYFDLDKITINDISLIRGDKFIEVYSPTKWFNIYEIYNGHSSHIKGWYCNITTPSIIGKSSIEYMDLALDLLVHPTGEQQVLDVDEFQKLKIPPAMKLKGLDALEDLQRFFSQKRPDILRGESMIIHIKNWLA